MTETQMTLAAEFLDSVLNWGSGPKQNHSEDDIWIPIVAGTVSQIAEESALQDRAAWEALIDGAISAAKREHGPSFSDLAASKTRDVLKGFVPTSTIR